MRVSGGLPGKGNATPGVGSITIESLWEDRQHLLTVLQVMREQEVAIKAELAEAREQITAYQIRVDNDALRLDYPYDVPDPEQVY